MPRANSETIPVMNRTVQLWVCTKEKLASELMKKIGLTQVQYSQCR